MLHAAVSVTWLILASLGFKTLIGFHFPWEAHAKAKKLLRAELETVQDRLTPETYRSMREALDKIN